MINSEEEYNEMMSGEAEQEAQEGYQNECYQDLEGHRLWTTEELVDKLIYLAHEVGSDMVFGAAVREELKKFDKK